MKQYIVMISLVALGVFIFNLTAGNSENSISSAMKNLWKKNLEIRTYTP